MASSGQREAVFPTRMTLGTTKARLKGAQNGHSLLKRKADALSKRFRISPPRSRTLRSRWARCSRLRRSAWSR